MENGDKIKFTGDIAKLQTEMEFVRLQVSNHLPTLIKEMKEDNDEDHEKIVTRLEGIERRMAYWGGGIAVTLAILEIGFRFIK